MNKEKSIKTNEYQVENIPLNKIFSDKDFNSRGAILPIDVIELAKNIEKMGLLVPISVQPWNKDGFDFRIIVGHCRYAAFKILKRETIPAIIKTGLSELSARLLNLSENLKRRDLNILQEAKAVKQLCNFGMRMDDIAVELGVSRSWVQVRFALLELPEDIQLEASIGHLNQYQIKQLASMSNNEQRYEAVRKIKNARLSGEKGIDVGKKADEKPFQKKRRTKTAVQEMINYLSQVVGYGLHTRVLAWANGEINTAELYLDIKRYAIEKNITYTVPLNLSAFEEIK